MIRHIVFDMGQVLVQFSAGLFTERLHLREEDAALIRREVLATTEWVRMDRGTISDDDALERMCARLPGGSTIRRPISSTTGTTPSSPFPVWRSWPAI